MALTAVTTFDLIGDLQTITFNNPSQYVSIKKCPFSLASLDTGIQATSLDDAGASPTAKFNATPALRL